MPLNTSIIRDGEPLKVNWNTDFPVAAMICAAAWDSGKGPFVDGNVEPPMVRQPDRRNAANNKEMLELGHYLSPSDCFRLCMYHVIASTPLNDGSYTLKHNYVFVDCTDGTILHLQPGDELKMFRSHK